MKNDNKAPGNNVISRSPFPASEKFYTPGRLHPIRVGMRRVTLSDKEKNAPTSIALYDTSGAYTDSTISHDVRDGLSPTRSQWIIQRGDVEKVETPLIHINDP